MTEPLRERMPVSTFGPSALNTPANAITVARLLATPVLVVMIVVHGPGWAPFAVALGIGLTDGVDGWLARRQGTTRSGAFLDPLADKAAVVGALCAVAVKGELSWLPVAHHRGARGVDERLPHRRGPARHLDPGPRAAPRSKTLVQGIAILLCLAPSVAPHHGVLDVAIWVAVAFTLVTGAQYLVDGTAPLGHRGPAGPARPGGAGDDALRSPT